MGKLQVNRIKKHPKIIIGKKRKVISLETSLHSYPRLLILGSVAAQKNKAWYLKKYQAVLDSLNIFPPR